MYFSTIAGISVSHGIGQRKTRIVPPHIACGNKCAPSCKHISGSSGWYSVSTRRATVLSLAPSFRTVSVKLSENFPT
eukprot:6207754-Prorocentrum_lima.AAC.1